MGNAKFKFTWLTKTNRKKAQAITLDRQSICMNLLSLLGSSNNCTKTPILILYSHAPRVILSHNNMVRAVKQINNKDVWLNK